MTQTTLTATKFQKEKNGICEKPIVKRNKFKIFHY